MALGAAGDSGIYSWTDQAGVAHFSDAPPPAASERAGTAPIELDEDTPIPATLNELFGASDPAGGGLPLGTTELPPQPPPDGPAGEALSVEELEALDPVWLRGNDSDGAELYVDERGPFTIGEPIENSRLPREQLCAAARRDLEVLHDTWPVYRDQSGRLRFQWERDPYRGARRYLDPGARASALAAVRQTLTRECATPDDPGAQTHARAQLMQVALCEAERAELEAMESLGGDSPTQTLAEKRALAAQVCGEPTPG